VVNLCEVYAADAQWWAEAAACVCVPGIAGWSLTELPLEGHNRRRILCLLLQSRNHTAVLSMVKLTLCNKKKKHRKSSQQSGACWWSFLTMRALFIGNFFLLTEQLNSTIAKRLFNIWGCKPPASIWNNGQTRLTDSP
jgi:hypothetical protein